MAEAHGQAAAESSANGAATAVAGPASRHSRLLIYDGGMGTTLEDDFGADISSNLWSSNLLRDEKNGHETLRALHGAFLDAGADLIQSCTYQSYLDGFLKNGYSDIQAKQMMRGAVSLVSDSVAAASLKKDDKGKGRELSSGESEPRVVLALSCYGATLSPGQEYTGVYPPPFGPPKLSTIMLDVSWRDSAIDALAEWHFERLKVFAEDAETWNKIKVVAFETLPVMYEAIAIRKAMTRLRAFLAPPSAKSASTGEISGENDKLHWPKWWISFVFPGGELPTRTSQERGTAPIAPAGLVRAVFSDSDQEGQLEKPTGIGINCTKMRYLPAIAQELTLAVQQFEQRDSLERWLVLYPDGGLVYDPITRTWHQDDVAPAGPSGHESEATNTSKGDPAAIWAAQLVQIAEDLLEQRGTGNETGAQGQHVWNKIVLGGCCKASPAYIAELSKLAKKQ